MCYGQRSGSEIDNGNGKRSFKYKNVLSVNSSARTKKDGTFEMWGRRRMKYVMRTKKIKNKDMLQQVDEGTQLLARST